MNFTFIVHICLVAAAATYIYIYTYIHTYYVYTYTYIYLKIVWYMNDEHMTNSKMCRYVYHVLGVYVSDIIYHLLTLLRLEQQHLKMPLWRQKIHHLQRHTQVTTRHQSNTQIYILMCSGKFVLHTKTHTHTNKNADLSIQLWYVSHIFQYTAASDCIHYSKPHQAPLLPCKTGPWYIWRHSYIEYESTYIV